MISSGPTQAMLNPEFGVKINFADMAVEYTYVLKKIHRIFVLDARMISILYKTNHYWPLNQYIGLTDIAYVASNPDDDCLFWEVIGQQLGPEADSNILTQLDTAYKLFKIELWEQYISPYLDEETKAQCRYIVHYYNNGLWIATGE